jgi:flagellar protein FliS
MNHTISSYQKVQVETTDSLKLVVMLYEGAINFLEQAKLRLSQNQVADKGILINKVVAIISELQESLNLDGGGEVASRLDSLYTYLVNRLMEANINNDSSALSEVANHLRTLSQAWKTISENGRQAEQNSPQADSVASTAIPAVKTTPDRAAPIELVG